MSEEQKQKDGCGERRIVGAEWLCLRTAQGKLLARFNPQSGVLEIRSRGANHTFCLPTGLRSASAPPFPPPPAPPIFQVKKE